MYWLSLFATTVTETSLVSSQSNLISYPYCIDYRLIHVTNGFIDGFTSSKCLCSSSRLVWASKVLRCTRKWMKRCTIVISLNMSPDIKHICDASVVYTSWANISKFAVSNCVSPVQTYEDNVPGCCNVFNALHLSAKDIIVAFDTLCCKWLG